MPVVETTYYANLPLTPDNQNKTLIDQYDDLYSIADDVDRLIVNDQAGTLAK